MIKTITTGIAAAIVAFAATASSAATVDVDFDFSHSSFLTSGSKTFTDIASGLEVTATAYKLDNYGSDQGSVNSQIRLGGYSGGLGACSDLYGYCNRDDHQVDGNGDEIIMFSFNKEVTLNSIDFSFVGRYDEFAFGVYDVIARGTSGVPSFYDERVFLPNGSGSQRVATYTFGAPNIDKMTSNIFGIGATGWDDEYKIRGFSVSYGDVAPVPLPAAGFLLIAALGGLGAMRRRNKAA